MVDAVLQCSVFPSSHSFHGDRTARESRVTAAQKVVARCYLMVFDPSGFVVVVAKEVRNHVCSHNKLSSEKQGDDPVILRYPNFVRKKGDRVARGSRRTAAQQAVARCYKYVDCVWFSWICCVGECKRSAEPGE